MILKTNIGENCSVFFDISKTLFPKESFKDELVPTGTMGELLKESKGLIKEVSEKTARQAIHSVAEFTKLIVAELSNRLDDVKPFDVSVEFGVQFSSEFEAMIISGSGESSLKITITCKKT